MKTSIQAVPENVEGKPVDIEKSVIKKTVEEAMATFKTACNRLINPDGWHEMPGFKGAVFLLQKKDNNTNLTNAEVGDYISIDIPGPGPGNGDGKDWVTIEYLETNFDKQSDESCGMRVRASINPNKEVAQAAASHFFKDMATSTFIIRRDNNKVTASYHGRNEIPNVNGNGIIDGLRNALVSFAAIAGLSEMQWTLLINGLLK